MNIHPFTYIIGYKHIPDRLNNLRRVLDWINGFNNVDIILVEQDTHSKISHLNLKCRHIFLKTDKDYNKSWAFNVATKYAKSDIIVFADSDLVMNPNELIDAIKQLDKFEMVNPYKSVIDLNPNESNFNLDQLFAINRPGRGETDHQKVPLCGGICIFRKDAIYKIGGWCEDFIGWGAEDDFVSLKVQKFLTHTELPYKCYHLYHTRGVTNMPAYQRNLDLYNNYIKLSNEDFIRAINNSVPKNAMLNKYE